jgi:hypothetical protein
VEKRKEAASQLQAKQLKDNQMGVKVHWKLEFQSCIYGSQRNCTNYKQHSQTWDASQVCPYKHTTNAERFANSEADQQKEAQRTQQRESQMPPPSVEGEAQVQRPAQEATPLILASKMTAQPVPPDESWTSWQASQEQRVESQEVDGTQLAAQEAQRKEAEQLASQQLEERRQQTKLLESQAEELKAWRLAQTSKQNEALRVRKTRKKELQNKRIEEEKKEQANVTSQLQVAKLKLLVS